MWIWKQRKLFLLNLKATRNKEFGRKYKSLTQTSHINFSYAPWKFNIWQLSSCQYSGFMQLAVVFSTWPEVYSSMYPSIRWFFHRKLSASIASSFFIRFGCFIDVVLLVFCGKKNTVDLQEGAYIWPALREHPKSKVIFMLCMIIDFGREFNLF